MHRIESEDAPRAAWGTGGGGGEMRKMVFSERVMVGRAETVQRWDESKGDRNGDRTAEATEEKRGRRW